MENQAKAPTHLLKVAQFLRSSKAGMKMRVGILNGKRVDYFKGNAAIKAIMSPAYAKYKGVPPQPQTEKDAIELLLSLIPFTFFLRIERGSSSSGGSSPKQVQIVPQQTIEPDLYYAWFYDGPQWTTYAGGFVMVAVILIGVMFPLWPPIMRLGAYYLSLLFFALIGLFFAIAIFRLIFYIITVIVASPGIWIFPKLFADVGFVESFIPLWEWDLPPKKKKRKVKGDKSEKIMNGLKSGISTGSEASLSTPTPSARSKIEEVPDEGSD